MKYCFIINPNAGKGTCIEELSESIKSSCLELLAEYDIYVSQSVDNTDEYVARSANECGDAGVAFIACGGDGTLCKTVMSVMKLPKEIRKNVFVGVVPSGTGNDFVSNFNNKHLFLDIKSQLESTTYAIDLLKCNDMYSVNMINIGFDCHVVCKKEEIGRRKWLPRKFAYIFSLVITLIKKPGVELKLSTDGIEAQKKSLLLTTWANGAFCGGGFNSNPKACLTDGKIDCITVENVSRVKFLTLVGDYKNGTHLGEKFEGIVDNFKSQTVDMYFDEETPVSVDGEVIRTKELHISVERDALNILLPKNVLPKVERATEVFDKEPVLQ